MQRHTDAAACHCQFRYACLEECTAEIAFLEGVGLFQEAVGLVGVGQVGGSHNHVFHLSGESAEYGSRCGTCSDIGFLFDCSPVHFGSLAGEEQFQFGCLFGIGFCPCGFGGIFFCHDALQFGSASGVKLGYFRKDSERIFRVTAQVLDCIYISVAAQRSTVCSAVGFVAAAVCLACTFTHYGVTDNQRRTLSFGFSLVECAADGICIVTVDCDDFPAPCLVFLCCIFDGYIFRFGGKLDVVCIIEHDEVVQSQRTGNTACTL